MADGSKCGLGGSTWWAPRAVAARAWKPAPWLRGAGVQDHRPLPHRREVSQPRGDHEGQVRVGEHGPLGPPRGARGVESGQAQLVALDDLGGAVPRRGRAHQLFERDRAGPRRLLVPVTTTRAVPTWPRKGGLIGVLVGDDGCSRGVLEVVGHLLGGEPGVQRHHAGADPEGWSSPRAARAGCASRCPPVAPSHPERAQPGTERAGAAVELRSVRSVRRPGRSPTSQVSDGRRSQALGDVHRPSVGPRDPLRPTLCGAARVPALRKLRGRDSNSQPSG